MEIKQNLYCTSNNTIKIYIAPMIILQGIHLYKIHISAYYASPMMPGLHLLSIKFIYIISLDTFYYTHACTHLLCVM